MVSALLSLLCELENDLESNRPALDDFQLQPECQGERSHSVRLRADNLLQCHQIRCERAITLSVETDQNCDGCLTLTGFSRVLRQRPFA